MDLSDNIPCPHCGRYKNRRVAVDAIILKDDHILLVKRAVEPFKNTWALPGGGIEFNETADEALRKEVDEEVGLQVVTSNFFNIYTKPERDPKQVIALVYIVEAEGEPVAGSDASMIKFFPLKDLPEIMGFDHRQIIQDYIDSKNSKT